MRLPNRIGLITLACRDVERMTRLFRAVRPPAGSAGSPWRNIWDVAHTTGSTIDDRGRLTFP